MLDPFATASRRIAIHQVSLLSHAACASMSTTTTTTRDRGDRYGPIEWAQSLACVMQLFHAVPTFSAVLQQDSDRLSAVASHDVVPRLSLCVSV